MASDSKGGLDTTQSHEGVIALQQPSLPYTSLCGREGLSFICSSHKSWDSALDLASLDSVEETVTILGPVRPLAEDLGS